MGLKLISKACRMEDTDRRAGEGNNMLQGNDNWARLACRCIARNRYGHNDRGCVWEEMEEKLDIQYGVR